VSRGGLAELRHFLHADERTNKTGTGSRLRAEQPPDSGDVSVPAPVLFEPPSQKEVRTVLQYIISQEDCVEMKPFPGIDMHAAEAERMTLSIVDMEPHSVIDEHSHPHEQVGYMVRGEAEFVIAGQTYHVRAGQMWRLPGGVTHKVVAGDRPVRAIDVFYPVREDMRGEWKAS
jgi:quercetin dioxygenase-like cupin family protein